MEDWTPEVRRRHSFIEVGKYFCVFGILLSTQTASTTGWDQFSPDSSTTVGIVTRQLLFQSRVTMGTGNALPDFGCEEGNTKCFKDCCERGVQFCNHNPTEKRCFPCSSREVYCNNKTLLPSECDLYCYKLQNSNEQDCIQSQIAVYVLGAIVGILLIYIIVDCIRNYRRTRVNDNAHISKEKKIPGSDESLLIGNNDPADKKAQDNEAGSDNDDPEPKTAAAGQDFSEDQPQPARTETHEIADLLGAEPWPVSLPVSARPVVAPPTRTQQYANYCEMQTEPQEQAGGSQRNESGHDNGIGRQNCLANIPPTTQGDNGRVEYAL